jgi:hypothetical protein
MVDIALERHVGLRMRGRGDGGKEDEGRGGRRREKERREKGESEAQNEAEMCQSLDFDVPSPARWTHISNLDLILFVFHSHFLLTYVFHPGSPHPSK